ncbi:MAG: HupE/UreJ family protein [Hyphomicrobiales bacterium]|nr:HupE/UreJ family protein [Hyphomicrobiales bacterium]
MKLVLAALAVLTLVPGVAEAHGLSQEHGTFAGGFLHPLSGLDHLLAMVTVGLWAGLLGGRATYALPLSFMAMMLAGFLLGRDVSVPHVEPVIAASGLVLGLLAARAMQLPIIVGVGVTGCFALFHGLAHGAEAPSGNAPTYALGMLVATLGLHLVGLGIGRLKTTMIGRGLGLATAAASVLLFVS